VGGGVFPHLFFKRRQARGLPEEQDACRAKGGAKTSPAKFASQI